MVPVLLALLFADGPTVDQIMSRVAQNQALAQDARKSFVYNQHILVRLLRGNGKLAREEIRNYAVTPDARGVHKELAGFEGRYEKGGGLISYDKPGFEYKDVDIDGELADDLCKDLTDDRDSRDGIAADLFPLTWHQQQKYEFALAGRARYRGRDVFRVRFRPAQGKPGGRAIWSGEAWIDAAEYQPVFVNTKMTAGIPGWVKVVLGTNIKSLGFALSYQKFGEGLWFPVSYGGEFEIRAVFFYKRKISISLKNDGFRKADVNSTVSYQTGGK